MAGVELQCVYTRRGARARKIMRVGIGRTIIDGKEKKKGSEKDSDPIQRHRGFKVKKF